MGRGSAFKKVAQVLGGHSRNRSQQPEFVGFSDNGSLRARIEGIEYNQQGKLWECKTKLWISQGYSDQEAEAMSTKLNQLLAEAPRVLAKAPKAIVVLDAPAPKVQGLKSPVACASDGHLLLFKSEDGVPVLHPQVIEHELVHLLGDGGPPTEITKDWVKAREADKKHSQAIAAQLSGGQSEVGEMRVHSRLWLLGEPWISVSAEDAKNKQENEDFALSVEGYLAWQRMPEGQVLLGQQAYGFEDLWPQRAQLIENLLA